MPTPIFVNEELFCKVYPLNLNCRLVELIKGLEC